MKVFAEGPWDCPPQIILGIDIGTTQSAVAFAFLYPGGPQSLQRVTAWPGQEVQGKESKIPTLIYYDSKKQAVSFGAEALKPETEEKAEDEGWQLARHFKLHLHPEAMRYKHNLRAQPLPVGVPLLKIYTDFMSYLLKHTKDFFESRIIDGDKLWKEHHKNMIVVLAHPNGWGLKEQNFLRQAAIAANYVSSAKATSQIRFVSEAEASVHFCMFHSDLHNRLKLNTNFIVCDAGGSTIDTTAYCVKAASPMLELEEKKASACVQAGGIFVDGEFEQYLSRILDRLDLDPVDRDDYLKTGVKEFEGTAKKAFENVDEEYRVYLGTGRLTKPEFKIRRGAITLDGNTIEPFFDNCVTQTVASVRQQMSGLECKHILLVGGFGDSLYLRKVLTDEFGKNGCKVNLANDSTAKAVADGAVIWCAKLSVIGRATRMLFGVGVRNRYNPNDPDHVGRPVHRHDAGYDYVTGKWSQIVDRDVVLNAAGAIRKSYWRSYKTPSHCPPNYTVPLFAFTLDNETPNRWMRDKNGCINRGFEEICEVEADLGVMRQALKKNTGGGGDYWYLDFTIGLQFGGTELHAFVEWEQDGRIRTGPAAILPSVRTNARA